MPAHLLRRLKLDPMTEARMRRLAKARGKSAQELISDAVIRYLEFEEGRERVLQDANAAWNEYRATGQHVTAEEADAWLDRLASGEDCEPPQPHR
jgi:predicted transcriptional regulator